MGQVDQNSGSQFSLNHQKSKYFDSILILWKMAKKQKYLREFLQAPKNGLSIEFYVELFDKLPGSRQQTRFYWQTMWVV